jgi:hypothetical protein
MQREERDGIADVARSPGYGLKDEQVLDLRHRY